MKTALFRPIRLISALALSVAAVLAPPASAARVVLVDRIVAVVDNEAITESALNERIAQVRRQFARNGTPLPPEPVLNRQVLERLVIERAQVQRAASTGLRIDDEALGRAIARVAASNKLSVPAFRAALEKDGIDWSLFRENIRQEMLISRLRERDVDARVVVTDAEIDNYLKDANAQSAAEQEYRLAHILLRAPDGASPEALAALAAQAQALRERIVGGEDFGQVAAAASNAPDALNGGDMGWRKVSALPGLFVEMIGDLKPGEVSRVMRSPAGFHIVKLLGARGVADATAAVPQTRVSHILVKTSTLVTDDDARLRLETLRSRIVNSGENFAELAKANSADLSAAKGGEIGWVYPGDTVPEFERAMDALAVGEVSQPVRSPFGWHLIRVEARRTEDASDERKRAIARNTLRQRKAEEAYEDWVRQLRDGTFVEYRLDTLN
ncbi:MAG: peptidylprolyl isomerase [Rhodocyclaceae bacterium]|nr:peptidylprolyl isomerase [Rhodocyclaceae bacterium]